ADSWRLRLFEGVHRRAALPRRAAPGNRRRHQRIAAHHHRPPADRAQQGVTAMTGRKIDIYNHVMPRAVADRMRELSPAKGGIVKRVTSIPMLYDIEARIRMIEQWPGYQQVLTIANPPLEAMAGPDDSPELARVANDELKKICDARP